MIRHFRTLVIGISLLSALYFPISFLRAEPSLLSDKHKVAGVSCGDCHKENPPRELVPMAVCYGCHGNQEKIAEMSRNVAPNPHDSHLGNLKCELCHHGHKPSENYCMTCHEFNFKVP